MKTIAIMNNKGGVGKTITAINLADILVRLHKKKVVLVDCDGQMNLTRFYLPEFDPEIQCTLVSLMLRDGEPLWSDNLMPLEHDLDLIPASPELYTLDYNALTASKPRGLGALVDFVDAAREDGEADYMIFDCPPGFTVASVSALWAADEVVIPMTVDGFSFAGMQDLQRQVMNLQAAKHDIRIAGVLITQHRNTDVCRQGEQLIRSMGLPVFNQTIRRTEKVPESTFDRYPIVKYSPGSAAAVDYRRWVAEYLGVEM